MRNLIFGIIIGMCISGGMVYAATTMKILLVDSSANNFGTSGNPVHITTS